MKGILTPPGFNTVGLFSFQIWACEQGQSIRVGDHEAGGKDEDREEKRMLVGGG